MTLEQLIEEKAFPTSQQPSSPMVIRVDDLRALFDGKVLVPVDAANALKWASKYEFWQLAKTNDDKAVLLLSESNYRAIRTIFAASQEQKQ